MDKRKEVILSGFIRYEPELPEKFTEFGVGDIVIKKGYPHIVINSEDQGLKLAGFKNPYGWKIKPKEKPKPKWG